MADPINNSLSVTKEKMLSQDDPGNFEYWIRYHEQAAERIANEPPGETESIRVGQLQGEMDHRSAAQGYRDEINKAADKDYSGKVRAELESRGVLSKSEVAGPTRAEIVEDTMAAFADYGIPQDLADHAVSMGHLDKVKDAGDREAFYNEVVVAKEDLDDLSRDNGTVTEIEGINDWKSAIAAAAVRFEKRNEPQQTASADTNAGEESDRKLWKELIGNAIKWTPRATEAREEEDKVQSGLQQAKTHWEMSSQQIKENYPLLQTEQEIRKVVQAGERRAWLASKIPEALRSRLGFDTDRFINNGVDRAYQKLIDKQADSLLKDRAKFLESLRGVNTATPTHLLPSKQYRAAENLVRIDQELRRLRPLPSQELGAAVASAKAETAGQRPQKAVEQALAVDQLSAQKASAAPAVVSKHDEALKAVRELRAQVPVDGFRSKAAEAMANRIVQQLQEGRSTVQLSTRYAGGDQGQANATHRNAVEANSEVIEAVRSRGIAVDTGSASVAPGKKAEVEFAPQAELDQSLG